MPDPYLQELLAQIQPPDPYSGVVATQTPPPAPQQQPSIYEMERQYREMDRQLNEPYKAQQEAYQLQEALMKGQPIETIPGQYAFKQAVMDEAAPKHTAREFLRNAAKDFADMWTGVVAIPAIGYNIATADEPLAEARRVGGQVVEGVKQEYSQAYGQGLSGFGQAVYERPVSRLLDVLGAASLGAGGLGTAATKLGQGGRIASALGKTSRIAGRTVNVLDPLGATMTAFEWAKKTPTGAALMEAIGRHPSQLNFVKPLLREKPIHHYEVRKSEAELMENVAGLTEKDIAQLGPALEHGSPWYREEILDGQKVLRFEKPTPEFEKAWNYIKREQTDIDSAKVLLDKTEPGRGLSEPVEMQGRLRKQIVDFEPELRKHYNRPDDYYRAADGSIQRGGAQRFLDDYLPLEDQFAKSVYGLDDATIAAMREATPSGMIFEPTYVRNINERFMPKDAVLYSQLHNRFLTTGGVAGKKPGKIRQHQLKWTGKTPDDQLVDAVTAFMVTKQEWLKQKNGLRLANDMLQAADSRVKGEWLQHLSERYGSDFRVAMATPFEQLDGFQREIKNLVNELESGKALVRVPINRDTGRALIELPSGYQISQLPDRINFMRTASQLSERQLAAVEKLVTSKGLSGDLVEELSGVIKKADEATVPLGETNYTYAIRSDLENKAQATLGKPGGLAQYLWDKQNNAFRYMVLKASPRWLAGNMIGSTVFHMMSRGIVGTIKDLPNMYRAFSDAGYVRKLHENGIVSPGQLMGIATSGEILKRQNLGRGLDRNILAKAVQNAGDFLTTNQNPILRAMREIPDRIGNVNEKIEAAFRSAHITDEFEKQLAHKLKGKPEAREFIKSVMAGNETHKVIAERLPDLIDAKTGKLLPEGVEMVREAREAAEYWTNYAHLNYTSFSPLERNVLKRIFPVSYSFWRGSALLALTYPVTHPMRSWTLGRLGAALAESRKDQTELPSYLLNSIYLGKDPASGKDLRWNVTAFNPLGQFASRLADADADSVGGLLSNIVIGPESLAPLLKIGFEQATGYELFRRQPFSAPGISKFSGEKVTPPLFWHLLSQVPQAGIIRDIATAIQRPEGMTGTHYGTSTPWNPQLYETETGAIKTPKPWYSSLRGLAGQSVSYFDPESYANQQTRERHTRLNTQFRELARKSGNSELFRQRAQDQARKIIGGF